VSPGAARTLTIVAAAVLAFDGAALTAMGWWGRRFMLVLMGVVFMASSGLVLLYWRWYRKRLDDIAAARQGLSDEVQEMRRLVREK